MTGIFDATDNSRPVETRSAVVTVYCIGQINGNGELAVFQFQFRIVRISLQGDGSE